MQIENHIEKLGYKATETVTGFTGVITSVSFDLYGCVQVVITPPAKEGEELKSGHWFDITRVELTSKKPVMGKPDFKKGYIAEGKKGCSEKSVPC